MAADTKRQLPLPGVFDGVARLEPVAAQLEAYHQLEAERIHTARLLVVAKEEADRILLLRTDLEFVVPRLSLIHIFVHDVGKIVGRHTVRLDQDLVVQRIVLHHDVSENFIVEGGGAALGHLLPDDVGYPGGKLFLDLFPA